MAEIVGRQTAGHLHVLFALGLLRLGGLGLVFLGLAGGVLGHNVYGDGLAVVPLEVVVAHGVVAQSEFLRRLGVGELGGREVYPVEIEPHAAGEVLFQPVQYLGGGVVLEPHVP